MSVYSVDKLISEARRLAREYYHATGKPLTGVSGELALNDAARLLGLELERDGQLGYDAFSDDPEKIRYRIKGRVIFDESKSGHRIGQLKMDQSWDRVLLVLMDADFETTDIYEADRTELEQAMEDSAATSRKKRGALSVAKFKIIGTLVWNKEEGRVNSVLLQNC